MLRTYAQAPMNPWKLLDQMTLNQMTREAVSAKPNAFPLDVIDQGDHLLVSVNLPGATAESVDVKLERNVLTISAKLEATKLEAVNPESVADAKYLWRERPSGEVRRSVKLPVRLNPDATTANFEHGVLTVTLAKTAESTARAIRVNAGPVVVQAEATTDAIQS
jgi:HSP20 family protein